MAQDDSTPPLMHLQPAPPDELRLQFSCTLRDLLFRSALAYRLRRQQMRVQASEDVALVARVIFSSVYQQVPSYQESPRRQESLLILVASSCQQSYAGRAQMETQDAQAGAQLTLDGPMTSRALRGMGRLPICLQAAGHPIEPPRFVPS